MLNRRVLSRDRKTATEGAEVTRSGRLFQTRAAATGKARQLLNHEFTNKTWKQPPKSVHASAKYNSLHTVGFYQPRVHQQQASRLVLILIQYILGVLFTDTWCHMHKNRQTDNSSNKVNESLIFVLTTYRRRPCAKVQVIFMVIILSNSCQFLKIVVKSRWHSCLKVIFIVWSIIHNLSTDAPAQVILMIIFFRDDAESRRSPDST